MSRPIDADALIKAIIRKEPFNDCARVVIAECVEEVRHAPTIEPEPKWIPCSVVNQCYIPELKDVDYKGILFTYETVTGKKLVKANWIERGRIIGKQMNGTPIAYMPLPEPYREEGDGK